jgi:hypothetical protein
MAERSVWYVTATAEPAENAYSLASVCYCCCCCSVSLSLRAARPAWLQRLLSLCTAVLDHPVVNLPLGATIVGIACAAIGPVRGLLVNELAPLHWVWLSLGWVGAAAAPLATMQIGTCHTGACGAWLVLDAHRYMEMCQSLPSCSGSSAAGSVGVRMLLLGVWHGLQACSQCCALSPPRSSAVCKHVTLLLYYNMYGVMCNMQEHNQVTASLLQAPGIGSTHAPACWFLLCAAGAELVQTAPVSDSMHVARRVQWTANAIAILVKLVVVSASACASGVPSPGHDCIRHQTTANQPNADACP